MVTYGPEDADTGPVPQVPFTRPDLCSQPEGDPPPGSPQAYLTSQDPAGVPKYLQLLYQ